MTWSLVQAALLKFLLIFSLTTSAQVLMVHENVVEKPIVDDGIGATLLDWWGGGGGFNAPEDIEPIVDWQKKQNAEERLQVFGDDFLGDAIDPHTGSLVFTHTDISLPGNSALPVALIRSRASGLTRKDGNDAELGDWDIKVPRVSVISLAARPWVGARCSARSTNILTSYVTQNTWMSATDYSSGITVSVEGASSAQILDDTGVSLWPSNAPKMTKDYWYFTCINAMGGGEGMIGHAPNGDKYRFDKFYTEGAPRMGYIGANPKGRDMYILAATEVTDVHGNWVRYTYDGLNRLTRILANDGRQITLTYSGSSRLIASASAHGRTWTYQYATNTYRREMWMPGHTQAMRGKVLQSVTQPDGLRWQFDLDDMTATSAPRGRDFCPKRQYTVSVTHPYGARGTFVLRDIEHRHVFASQVLRTEDCNSGEPMPGGSPWSNAGSLPLDNDAATSTMALVQKNVTGANMPTATWLYTYESDTSSGTSTHDRTNWTRVQTPSHHETYFHSWVSEPLGGKLVRKEIRATSGSAVLKTERYQYQQEAQIGYAYTLQYPGPGDINTPVHQTSVIIEQDGDTFTNTSTFNIQQSSSAYSFAKPVTTTVFSNVSSVPRVTTYTYEHNKPKWILGLQKKRVISGREIDRNDFDANGKVTQSFRYNALYAKFGYASNGTLTWAEDAVLRRYNAYQYKAGMPQRIIRPDGVDSYQYVDMFGGLTSLIDANNNTWLYSRDTMGRLTLVDPPGSWTNTVHTYSFNNAVGPIHTITHGPSISRIFYDSRFRPVKEQRHDTVTNRISDTVIDYDSAGREVFRSFPSFSSNPTAGMTKAYDALSRIITQAENVSPFATTHISYHNSHRKTVTDPANVATDYYHYGYSGPNYQFVRAIRSPHNTNTDMVRNVFNELTSVRQWGWHNGISVDQTRHYYYDSRRRVCRINEPDVGNTLYQYDIASDLIAYQKGAVGGTACNAPSGVGKVSLIRDDIGRVEKRDYAHSGTADVELTFDNVGNVLTLNRDGVNWTYAYNTLHKLTSEGLALDGRHYNTHYQYNLHGHVTSTLLPGGTSFGHQPDGLGRPRAAGSYASNAFYHADGQLSTFSFGNQFNFSQTLNPRMLPQRLLTTRGSTKALDLNYTYDARKLVTNITDGARANNNRTMGYDGLERLISATGPWGQGSVIFDSLGNIRSKDLGSRQVDVYYDSNLRVSQSVDTGGLGGNTGNRLFSYDNRGNTTSAGNINMVYDYADQPISVTGIKTGTYQYDGNFKRVKNTVGGDTIYNVFTQSGQLAHVHNISKNERTDYVKLGGLSVARVKNGTPTYLHHDQLGSAVSGTNTSGTVTWSERYSPFGLTFDNPTDNEDQAGFTGHIKDSDTGLVYMQARYYDPVIGRFYSNDPVGVVEHFGGAAGIHGFNRYAYVNNNPYKFTDPSGMAPEFVDAIKQQVQLIAQSLGYSSPSQGNQNIAADSASAIKQVASDVGNAAMDVATVTASVTGSVAADSLAPAAAVSAVIPGGQGVAALLTVADVAVNGGLAEAIGSTTGTTTSALVGDVLTDFGKKSPNLGVRVVSEVANQVVSRAAADTVNTQVQAEDK